MSENFDGFTLEEHARHWLRRYEEQLVENDEEQAIVDLTYLLIRAFQAGERAAGEGKS